MVFGIQLFVNYALLFEGTIFNRIEMAMNMGNTE